MTISSAVRKAGPYIGNNVTTAFQFGFKVFAATDVVVVSTNPDGKETTLTQGANYTIALNADQDANPGGTVTLPSALAGGNLLTITSAVAPLQPVDLTNMGGFYPDVINAALDRLTILAQQAGQDASRAVKVPISSNTSPEDLIASILAAAASSVASAAAAASSATAAANAIPSGSLGYTPVNITGDTMTGNLAVPGLSIGGSGVISVLTNFAKTLLDDADAATARDTLGAQAAAPSIASGDTGFALSTSYLGKVFYFGAPAAGQVYTLPDVKTAGSPLGSSIRFFHLGQSANPVTLQVAAGMNAIYTGASDTAAFASWITINPHEGVDLIYIGGNDWMQIGGSGRLSIIPQAEAEAGTSTVPKAWTAQRVAQAIAAHATSATGVLLATQLLTAGTSVTAPTGATVARVRVLGGGGKSSSGKGGGGGGYSEKVFAYSGSGAYTINYVIGAGGSANTGAAGTSSATYNGVTITAAGGSNYGTAQTGGAASGGDINVTGGTGSIYDSVGGGNYLFPAPSSVWDSTNGVNRIVASNLYGVGGASGNGQPGCMLIDWYK